MRALILTGRMVQDQEGLYPLHRLQEAGFAVDVAADNRGDFFGIQGVKFTANRTIFESECDDYDLLVIPGGVKCMEHLRLNLKAVRLVKDFYMDGKVIASICSGAQMLISAGLCKGKVISAYPAMQVDVENAGAEFVNRVVSFDRIISAPHYNQLGPWMAEVLRTLAREQELRNAA